MHCILIRIKYASIHNEMINLFWLNSGVSLLLMSTVAFIVIIFRISINPSSPPVESSGNDTSCCCFPSFRNRTTLFSMGLALICALIMVFWYMVCFALWIAGSYLVIITIKQMRMPSPNHQSGCDLSVVSVAGSATIFIWIVFFGFCCSQCCCKQSRKNQTDNANKKIAWMVLTSLFIILGYLGVAWMCVRSVTQSKKDDD